MTESMITLQGYVGAEPVLRQAGGHSVANFRVACTPRRLNRATGEWADAPTQWYAVSAWRKLGENVARSLRKGDAVVVHGRLSARTYINKDGFEVNTWEVEATVVGHDLNRGVSQLMKNERRAALPMMSRTGEAADRTALPPDTALDETERAHADAVARARQDWGDLPMAEPPGFEGAGQRPDAEAASESAA